MTLAGLNMCKSNLKQKVVVLATDKYLVFSSIYLKHRNIVMTVDFIAWRMPH